MPLVRRTRATLRRAEFGFFGVFGYTRVQTPRRCGAPFNAGALAFCGLDWRPFRTSCWMVGTNGPFDAWVERWCSADGLTRAGRAAKAGRTRLTGQAACFKP